MKESNGQIRYIAGLATETAASVSAVAAARQRRAAPATFPPRRRARQLTQEAVSVAGKASKR